MSQSSISAGLDKKPEKDFSSKLWNDDETEGFNNETYHTLLMEQYKIHVGVADNISARRTIVNTFFLTLHGIIISVIGLSLSRQPTVPNLFLLLITLLGLLGLCFAWWKLARYYRYVTKAKKQVIAELEARLPSNVSLASDKYILSSIRNNKNPLHSIETTIPIAFSVLYILAYGFVAYFTHISS